MAKLAEFVLRFLEAIDFNVPAEIINCTPHDVVVVDPDNGQQAMVFPSGGSARTRWHQDIVLGKSMGVTFYAKDQYEETTGLPPEKDGRMCIVSFRVQLANPNRTDLLVPRGVVRDENDEPKYCHGFTVNV